MDRTLDHPLITSPRQTLFWLGSAFYCFFYPSLIGFFSHALPRAFSEPTLASISLCALTSLAVFACFPVGAFLLANRRLDHAASAKMRAMAHLLMVLPALNTLVFVVSYMTASLNAVPYVWITVTAALLGLITQLSASPAAAAVSPAMRVFHGVLATVFIGGFFLLHWANHLTALWSSNTHGIAQDFFRRWYQSPWVEPVLLIVCALLLLTGVYLSGRYLRRDTDKYKRWQSASGCYLGVFFCAHLIAVLMTRARGGETDWAFATGEQGLIHGFQFLIPYYAFALLAFSLHASLGLRQVLLNHTNTHSHATLAGRIAATSGYVLTALVMLAALGFSFQPLEGSSL